MSTQNTKQIKAIDIINKSKQEFTKKSVTVKSNTGDEFEILIQEKMNETALSEIVAELVVRSEEFNKLGLEFDMILNIYALLLKQFTDIKFNKSKDIVRQINHEVELVRSLVDLGLLEQILNSFDKDSINKLEQLFDMYPKQMGTVINNIVESEVLADANVQ